MEVRRKLFTCILKFVNIQLTGAIGGSVIVSCLALFERPGNHDDLVPFWGGVRTVQHET